LTASLHASLVVVQFMRSLPLVVLPMIMRTNMDLLFGTFAIFFYGENPTLSPSPSLPLSS
jgi:hypothetical protein